MIPPRLPPVAIGFRHVVGRGFWSRLIKVIAGPPVHCAIVFSDGQAFDASITVGVARFQLTPEQLDAEAWELLPITVDPVALRRWCLARLGKRYDVLGALLYFTPLTSRDRWTCSEFCVEGVVACGESLSLLGASQTPRRLRRLLRSRLTGPFLAPVGRAA
jgi:hypothetical protein